MILFFVVLAMTFLTFNSNNFKLLASEYLYIYNEFCFKRTCFFVKQHFDKVIPSFIFQ